MPTDPTTPQRPKTEELAKIRGTGVVVGQPFVELLQPDDSILLTKGRNYQLYRETLRDDRCASTFADRRLAVTSKEWIVDAASEDRLDVAAAEFIREELQRLEWDRITDKMLFARWYGHSVAECLYYVDGPLVRLQDIRVRDRSRFAYSTDGGVWLLSEAGQWERMPDRKFWTVSVGADHDDAPFGLGLAHYCYWPVFFKRNALKFWLVFAEKFGAPTAVGKIPGGKWGDDELKDAVLDALQCFASESAIVIPEEATVTLLEAVRSGAGTYDELYDRMDAALAQIVVGQTASTAGTPGKLGNENLQEEVRLDLVKADADLVCGSFNRGVIQWLVEWNFPGAKAPKVWRKVEPDEDLKAAAETDGLVKALGFTPDEDYIRKRYGDHWKKAEPLNLGGPGLFGQGPPTGDDPVEFADVAAVMTLRAGKRADQEAIKGAALYLAGRYEEANGPRVAEILSYAEESGDYRTMADHILRMVAEGPPGTMVEPLRRSTAFSRLWGALRGQR